MHAEPSRRLLWPEQWSGSFCPDARPRPMPPRRGHLSGPVYRWPRISRSKRSAAPIRNAGFGPTGARCARVPVPARPLNAARIRSGPSLRPSLSAWSKPAGIAPGRTILASAWLRTGFASPMRSRPNAWTRFQGRESPNAPARDSTRTGRSTDAGSARGAIPGARSGATSTGDAPSARKRALAQAESGPASNWPGRAISIMGRSIAHGGGRRPGAPPHALSTTRCRPARSWPEGPPRPTGSQPMASFVKGLNDGTCFRRTRTGRER